MKQLTAVVAVLLLIGSCTRQPEGEQSETRQKQNVKEATEGGSKFKVNVQKSVIKWVGSKPGGQHNGTVNLKSGTIDVNNGSIDAGRFVIDMNTIKDLDLENKGMREKLVNHLKSDDFFYTEKYPEAVFELTNVQALNDAEKADNGITPTHKMSGNLTLRDTTQNISFKAALSVSGDKLTAKSVKFLIDRTKWNVNHMSKSIFDNLKDKFVHDKIAIEVRLHAKK